MEIDNDLAAVARRMSETFIGTGNETLQPLSDLVEATYARSSDADSTGGSTNAARGNRAPRQRQRRRLWRRSRIGRSDHRAGVRLRFKCYLRRRRSWPDAAHARDGCRPRRYGLIRCGAERCRRNALSSNLLDRFGNVELAVAAYNAGPDAVRTIRRRPAVRRDQKLRTKRHGELCPAFSSRQPRDQCRITGPWHHRSMMTQQLEVSILAAPLAAIDRRALSQAWYSALHLARPDRAVFPSREGSPCAVAGNAEAAPRRETGHSSAPPGGTRVAHSVQTKPSKVAAQPSPPRIPADRDAVPSEPTNRTPLRVLGLADQTCDVFDGPRRGPSPRDPPDEWKCRDPGRALPPADATVVARALAHARFVLAARGFVLDLEMRGEQCS